MSDGEKKTFKWEVKKGGTVPADSLNIKHATTQANSTSQKEALKVQKGAGGSQYGAGAVAVTSATSVPDASFGTTSFQKSDANHNFGDGALAVDHALHTPAVPARINTVDVTERVTGNNAGFD
eukprot:m.27197 g.27197  ORF g.27197 m.27197 type:complete len:123 (+) comp13896_c0_seq3:232-600(+)